MGFLASLDRRRVLTAIIALVLAFGSGHLMQTVLRDDNSVATFGDQPDAAPVLRRNETQRPLPTPPAATLTPILERPPVLPGRAAEGRQGPIRFYDDASLSPFGLPCEPVMTVDVRKAAMLEIALSAPCNPGARITIRHGDLSISAKADGYGRLAVRLPAFSDPAVITAEFGGVALKSEVAAPEATGFSRVVLAWEGQQVFQLHAFEFGANPGESGHIWRDRPKSVARALRGSGGFLVRVGDGSGSSAEIYSFPAGLSPLQGVVRLIAQGEVTEETCGRLVRASTFQSGPLGRILASDLAFAMPGCDALGEIVVLNNLMQDMRLAGR
jgi:hypothetical protein